MKKFIFTVAIVLGGLTAMNAQTNDLKSANDAQKETLQQQKQDLNQKQSLKQQQNATLQQQQQEPTKAAPAYQTLDQAKVPSTVKQYVTKNHKGATISQASVNTAGVYKLEVVGADKAPKTIYVDKTGREIRQDLKQ